MMARRQRSIHFSVRTASRYQWQIRTIESVDGRSSWMLSAYRLWFFFAAAWNRRM
jgi:hypothetical protein